MHSSSTMHDLAREKDMWKVNILSMLNK